MSKANIKAATASRLPDLTHVALEDEKTAQQNWNSLNQAMSLLTYTKKMQEARQIASGRRSLYNAMVAFLGTPMGEPINLGQLQNKDGAFDKNEFLAAFAIARERQFSQFEEFEELMEREQAEHKRLNGYIYGLRDMVEHYNNLLIIVKKVYSRSGSKIMSGAGFGQLDATLTKMKARQAELIKIAQKAGQNDPLLAQELAKIKVTQDKGTARESVADFIKSFFTNIHTMMGFLAESQFVLTMHEPTLAEVATGHMIESTITDSKAGGIRGGQREIKFQVDDVDVYYKKGGSARLRDTSTKLSAQKELLATVSFDGDYHASVKTTKITSTGLKIRLGGTTGGGLLSEFFQHTEKLDAHARFMFYRLAARGISQYDGANLHEAMVAINLEDILLGFPGDEEGAGIDFVTDFVINNHLISAEMAVEDMISHSGFEATPASFKTITEPPATLSGREHMAAVERSAIKTFNEKAFSFYWKTQMKLH